MAYLRMSYFGTGTMKFFTVTSVAQFAVFRLTEVVCVWSFTRRVLRPHPPTWWLMVVQGVGAGLMNNILMCGL